MGLELRRDKNRNLRSKWWYGRFMVNGNRRFFIPESSFLVFTTENSHLKPSSFMGSGQN